MLPENPEDWTDEEWLDWLAEGDAEERRRAESGEGKPERPPLPSWRKRTIAGQIVAASMIGVAEALYGKKEEPAIVIEASGEPPGDEGFDVELDPDRPDESVVTIRPWLLRHDG